MRNSGFKIEKEIFMIGSIGTATPPLACLDFIFSNLLAYPPIIKGQEGGLIWNSQRDQTSNFSEFEHLAFRQTRKLFFCPPHLIATLHDDPFGTHTAAQVNNSKRTQG